MTDPTVPTLVLIPAAAVLAPVLSAALARFVRIPLVVFEILLGILIGPAVLGWVVPGEFISRMADVGLAMLFFLAGSEIDFRRIRGRSLNRSIGGWLIALCVGVLAGMVIDPSLAGGTFIGIALTSTALGTLMPILRDAGELRTNFGTAVTAIGAVGEFAPLVAISLFLSGRQPGAATAVLIAFTCITGVLIYLAGRGEYRGLHTLITASLHTSGQFAVRLVILVLTALVGLSIVLELDMLLGAFAAGVLIKLLLANATPGDASLVESKLEAVGFGFLVPIFFIFTGVTFDLHALVSSRSALILLPVFLVLLLLIRGVSGLATAPAGSSAADKRALILLAATGLPIIVAVTRIGVTTGDLSSATGAALVGAGMLSVLIFPLLALQQRQGGGDEKAAPDELADDGIDEG